MCGCLCGQSHVCFGGVRGGGGEGNNPVDCTKMQKERYTGRYGFFHSSCGPTHCRLVGREGGTKGLFTHAVLHVFIFKRQHGDWMTQVLSAGHVQRCMSVVGTSEDRVNPLGRPVLHAAFVRSNVMCELNAALQYFPGENLDSCFCTLCPAQLHIAKGLRWSESKDRVLVKYVVEGHGDSMASYHARYEQSPAYTLYGA